MGAWGGSLQCSVVFPVPPRQDRASENGWCERDPPLRAWARHRIWPVWDDALVFHWSDELAAHRVFCRKTNHAKAVENGDWNITETMAIGDDRYGLHTSGDCHPKHEDHGGIKSQPAAEREHELRVTRAAAHQDVRDDQEESGGNHAGKGLPDRRKTLTAGVHQPAREEGQCEPVWNAGVAQIGDGGHYACGDQQKPYPRRDDFDRFGACESKNGVSHQMLRRMSWSRQMLNLEYHSISLLHSSSSKLCRDGTRTAVAGGGSAEAIRPFSWSFCSRSYSFSRGWRLKSE